MIISATVSRNVAHKVTKKKHSNIQVRQEHSNIQVRQEVVQKKLEIPNVVKASKSNHITPILKSLGPSPRPRGSARRKTASSLILRGHI